MSDIQHAGGMTPADRDKLKALWPWTGDADRLVDGLTGWDIVVDPTWHPHRIDADLGTAVITCGDREHLRRMLKLEHARIIEARDRAAQQLAIRRQREASNRAIRNTIRPYRDPDVIPTGSELEP